MAKYSNIQISASNDNQIKNIPSSSNIMKGRNSLKDYTLTIYFYINSLGIVIMKPQKNFL